MSKINSGDKTEEVIAMLGKFWKGGYIPQQDVVQEKKLMITANEAAELSLKNLPQALKQIETFIKHEANAGLRTVLIHSMWFNPLIIKTLTSHPYNYQVEAQGNSYNISW